LRNIFAVAIALLLFYPIKIA